MELVTNVFVVDLGNGKAQFGNNWPHAVGPTIAVLGQIVFIASNKVVAVDVKHVRVSGSSRNLFQCNVLLSNLLRRQAVPSNRGQDIPDGLRS
jgi:hypothetical protein